MDDRFRVTLRRERVTAGLEAVPECLVVVNFPVVDDPSLPGLVGHRLEARVQIDDAESLVGEDTVIEFLHRIRIGPAVTQDVVHLADQIHVDSPTRIVDAADSAHLTTAP